MDVVAEFMRAYPYVFHPSTVLGVGILVLVHYEWAHQDDPDTGLWPRVGAFLVAGVLALAPTAVYMLVTGSGIRETTQGNVWQVDALVAGGIFITAAVTWLVWRHYDWGALVPPAMVALAAVTVPYAALSPFWNVSGHTITALMPTLYLTLVDRKFWPLLAIPAVMVPNRIYLDAHTWPQVVGAVVLTVVVVVALYWHANGGSLRPASQGIGT
ncbi:phosphatase PAP2 family protein [Halorubellus sp. JP-L1]|uniref:phosphatase PAP2 family protein n=1 Tax=Halorubellus sp. JP-L1 TaxID=2715753 RepID=UPI00140C8D35|nr:phosphatase PAP2 family protein [Halorubellus sp. JP-L1]NHN42727.1 phosphatase PAP2 family protein [Halorubellus sp. JP-L1]